MRRGETKRGRRKEGKVTDRRERKEGGRDVREKCKKSSPMQRENAEGNKGNLWVKTCFLG